MKALATLGKYFKKYKWRLTLGFIFVTLSNIFDILSPPIIRQTLDSVFNSIKEIEATQSGSVAASLRAGVIRLVMINGILLLAFAIIRGVFMFFMRQTIIVMSRHIEYDQKNEIYEHYQKLDTAFYKRNTTGDLMNRISEDVSLVRQYTGPAIMYIINLVTLTVMSLWAMIRISPELTAYSVAPLPILAFTIWYVNNIVNKKGEKIQVQLSRITTKAQESYSGIRVIKSFNDEEHTLRQFSEDSEVYRKNNIALASTEAIYFPAMTFFIGISVIITVMIGGKMVMDGALTTGNIVEFVIYITKMTFPISAIGWTANMITRANVSQRRINEFLHTTPDINNAPETVTSVPEGNITFKNVSFTYPHTGIEALKHFDLDIKKGEKVCVIGKAGSGKSTLSHLLLRMYDVSEGSILMDGRDIERYDLDTLRQSISYVPQEVFLFSDTIENNIAFGNASMKEADIQAAAKEAAIHNEIMELPQQYETIVGERGVMLSGGQKQRISIARALAKEASVLLLDDCLSAVDTRTEHTIQQNLKHRLKDVTTIVITHRIFKDWDFDKIIVLNNGTITEQGTHEELMRSNGRYAKLYQYQTERES